ncbi:MAG TPA: dihydrofolate reductase [Chitinophagaceae bacterium]|nr:dihydrofolate reductase [Chitinophagaceae bacterium]
MTLSAIAAASSNDVIGLGNRLPWKLPADLRYFKNVTWGMPVIMGRKTYESVDCPLPGRINIVVTSNREWKRDQVQVAPNVEAAIRLAREARTREIFIAGGAAIFREAFDLLDRIYLTRINARLEGDAFFPPIPESEWALKKDDPFPADDKNPYDYSFQVWERKSPRMG